MSLPWEEYHVQGEGLEEMRRSEATSKWWSGEVKLLLQVAEKSSDMKQHKKAQNTRKNKQNPPET